VLSDASARWLTDDYPVTQIVGMRAGLVVLMILVISAARRDFATLQPVNVRGQIFRGVMATASVYLFILGLTYVALAEAAAAASIGPLIMTAAAPWLLGERVGIHRWAAVIIGFLGMLVMLRPSPAGLAWGMLIPASAALFGATRDMTTRRIRQTESAMSLLFCSNTIIASAGAVMALFVDWQMFNSTDTVMLVVSAALIGAAHYLHIQAFRLEQASVLAPFRYTGIIWAALLGFLIWGEVPDRYLVFGGLIVVASGLYIIHRERRASRQS